MAVKGGGARPLEELRGHILGFSRLRDVCEILHAMFLKARDHLKSMCSLVLPLFNLIRRRSISPVMFLLNPGFAEKTVSIGSAVKTSALAPMGDYLL